MKQCAANYMKIGGDPVLWRYIFKEKELQEFCEQLCQEQREICDKEMYKQEGCFYGLINCAPMPEL